MSRVAPVHRRGSPSISHSLTRLRRSAREAARLSTARLTGATDRQSSISARLEASQSATPSCFGPNVSPAVAASLAATGPCHGRESSQSLRETSDRGSVTASELGRSTSLIEEATSVSARTISNSSLVGDARTPETKQGFRSRHVLRITYLNAQGSACRLDIVFSNASRLKKWQEGLKLLLKCPPWPWLPSGEALWARRVFNAADLAREGSLVEKRPLGSTP